MTKHEITNKIATNSWHVFPFFMVTLAVFLSAKSILTIVDLLGTGNPVTWLLEWILAMVSIVTICFFQVMHNVLAGKAQ